MEDYRILLGFIVGTLLFAIVMIGLELITDAYEDRKKKKNNNK